MRKFFSLIAAVLFAGSMFAAEESVDFSAQGYTNAQEITSYVGTHFSVAFDKGTNSNSPKYYNTGTAIRCYGSNTFTVSSSENIVKIELTFGSGDGANEITAAPGAFSVDVWNGSANSVVFTIGGTSGQRRIKGIKVTTGEAPSVVAPVIDGESHFYEEAEITLSCATEGATIYYTMNGSDPDANSIQYMGSFFISSSMTIKAIAILGEDASAISERAFVRNPSFDSFEALVAAELANNTLVEVAFADLAIDSFYTNSQEKRYGIYFTVGTTAYEIYFNKAEIPATWEEGGKVSGTIRGNWTYYQNGAIWELVPSAADWGWNLTYDAPVENGYYLVGTMNNWKALAEYKMTLNEGATDDTEYMYHLTLALDDRFKVVEVVDGNWTWHPGEGDGYEVDADHVGAATVYFRPNGKQDPAWYYTIIYVAMDGETAIDNTAADAKAVKFFENGQLIIIKNGVRYNAQGAIVK